MIHRPRYTNKLNNKSKQKHQIIARSVIWFLFYKWDFLECQQQIALNEMCYIMRFCRSTHLFCLLSTFMNIFSLSFDPAETHSVLWFPQNRIEKQYTYDWDKWTVISLKCVFLLKKLTIPYASVNTIHTIIFILKAEHKK